MCLRLHVQFHLCESHVDNRSTFCRDRWQTFRLVVVLGGVFSDLFAFQFQLPGRSPAKPVVITFGVTGRR